MSGGDVDGGAEATMVAAGEVAALEAHVITELSPDVYAEVPYALPAVLSREGRGAEGRERRARAAGGGSDKKGGTACSAHSELGTGGGCRWLERVSVVRHFDAIEVSGASESEPALWVALVDGEL